MKLTNKHGIPQTFVNVLERPTYSQGKAQSQANYQMPTYPPTAPPGYATPAAANFGYESVSHCFFF